MIVCIPPKKKREAWSPRLSVFMIPRAMLACTKPARADKRRRSRSIEHDVRAKQARACDAERAGFPTPAHASSYLDTDGKLIVQGRIAYSHPSLTASLTYRMPRRGISSSQSWKTRLKIGRQVFPPVDDNTDYRCESLHFCEHLLQFIFMGLEQCHHSSHQLLICHFSRLWFCCAGACRRNISGIWS